MDQQLSSKSSGYWLSDMLGGIPERLVSKHRVEDG